MIVLDTNVISDIFTQKPNPRLINWLNAQESPLLYLPTIVLAELYFGAHLVKEIPRREGLLQNIGRVKNDFAGRVLVFGESAAEKYGIITSERRKLGQPIETKDAMIAAICLIHDAVLATRNTSDFGHIGLAVINPFEAGA